MALPEGWQVNGTVETVPNPNTGTIYGQGYFTRQTYICTDARGQFVCASGSEEDCYAQAYAMAQSATQENLG
jgi:hypothetical protein